MSDIIIGFPSLGLEFCPSRVAFTVFGKDIYWYGIIIAVGFALAVWYALKNCGRFGVIEDDFITALCWGVPVGIICARLYYVIFNLSSYLDNPISMLYVWEGGLAIYGGVIGAVITVFVYTRARKIKMMPILDIVALGFLIGQTMGRWGNFINREAYGSITDSFFRMTLTNPVSGTAISVHPTFLYESVWNIIGFILLHFLSKKRKFDGQIFLSYVAWYGLGRGFIEGLRTDSLYWGGIRVSQLLGFLSCAIAVILLIYILFVKKPGPERMAVNIAAAKAAEPEKPENEEKEDENEGENQ